MKITTNSPNFQSRKIPRYIYHLTNQKAYDSILKDGFIRTSENDPYTIKRGIHAIELSNFIKHWLENKSWAYCSDCLQEALLREVVKWTRSLLPNADKLVILRIPTANLDKNQLAIRGQDTFFEFNNPNKKKRVVTPELLGLTPASEAQRYKKKKKAIEYIYYDNIPIQNVEHIGNIVNIPELRRSPEYNCEQPVQSILKALLKGTPEANAIR